MPRALRKWGRDLAAIAFLALVTIIFFWKVLFTSDYTLLSGWDGSIQWYAWYRFAADWVRQGVLPLWDPFVYGGHSFIGEAQAGLFYPLNLLQAFLIPAGRSLLPSDIYHMMALHGFFAAAFMYIFARVLGMLIGPALVAAIVYAFGGFVAHRLFGHLNIFYGVVWLPLLLAFFHLAVTRRRPLLAVAAGLGLGIVTLVGHLMPPVYSALVLGAYALYLVFGAWRRRKGRAVLVYPLAMLAVTGLFAAGIAAIQMLPSLEYEALALKWTGAPVPPLLGSARSSYEVASSYYYFHPQQLVSYFMPFVYSPEEGSSYLGILPLGLIAVGALGWRKNGSRFFVALALVAFAFALGRESIIHPILWALVPFLEKARIAVRGLFVVSLCAAVLAGCGMQAMLAPTPRTRRLVDALQRYSGYALGVLIIAGLALSMWGTQQKPPAKLDFYYSALLMSVLAWMAIALWKRLLPSPRAWQAIVIGVLLFDLLSHGAAIFPLVRDFNRTTNWAPETYYRDTGAVEFLQQQPGNFRIDVQNNAISPNEGDVWQIPSVTGHGNTMIADYYTLRSLGWQPGTRLYDLLNIRYIVTTDTLKTLPLVYAGDAATGDPKVYENPTALPRAWLVHKATPVTPGDDTWRRLQQPDFDPATEAVVASPVALPGGGSGGTARVAAYTLHNIAVAVDTPSDALLVTAENYYPGWVARIDGEAAPIVKVDGALRGVTVPAGQHDVIFSYEPRSFTIGAVITVTTLLVAVLLFSGYAVARLVRRQGRAA